MMHWRIKSLFTFLFVAYVSQEGQVYNSEESQHFIPSDDDVLLETPSASHTQCIHRCRLKSECKQSVFSRKEGICIMLKTDLDMKKDSETDIYDWGDHRKGTPYQIATSFEFKG